MNKRIMKMLILCISFFISFSAASLKAQELFDCPPNVSESDWGERKNFAIEYIPYHFMAYVHYYERTVDEKVEILVDWDSLKT